MRLPAFTSSRNGARAVIGMHRMLAGDRAAGRALVTRTMELNPCHSSWLYLALSPHALRHRRYDAALAALSPFAAVEFFPFQINLAVIHGHLRQEEEARRCQARMFRPWPEAAGMIEEIPGVWFPWWRTGGDLSRGTGAGRRP